MITQIFSRHPSHNILRGKIKFPFRSVVRFGSINPGTKKYPVQINTIEAVQTSANKRLMKEAFDKTGISTARWYPDLNSLIGAQASYPVIAKHIFGSRGTGNFLLKNRDAVEGFLNGRNVHNYIFEEYYSYNREYRLHVTEDGCFYTCRKMLKSDTPEDKRWFRNDSNSIWIVEDNPEFDKPANWNTIVEHCVLGLKAVGLDVGAFDVRVQSKTDKKGNERKNPDFIIIESNSAPSFGEITAQKYLEILPSLITKKAQCS